MRLSKVDALALAKALHQLVPTPQMMSTALGIEPSAHEARLLDLQERLDDFLLEGDDEEEFDDDPEVEGAGEEEDPAEAGGAEEEEGEEGDGEEEDLHTGFEVSDEELIGLGKLKTEEGRLHFATPSADGNLPLYLDKSCELSDVTHLKRLGKQLHVRSGFNGSWTVYGVARFPKAWTELLDLDCLYEVVQCG